MATQRGQDRRVGHKVKPHQRTRTWAVTLAFSWAIGAAMACGSDSAPPAGPPLFDLLPLAGQSTDAVERALGAPVSIDRSAVGADFMPGEYREYDVPGTAMPVSVRFHQNRAVFFAVYLPEQEPSAEAALLRVGIDVQGQRPTTRAPVAVWWRDGTLDGVRYTRMGAQRGIVNRGDAFDLVQAEFP